MTAVNELLHQIGRSIAERRLLKRGDRILVAVSGGVDSMVLLHLLHTLSARHRWRLVVAHFNHQLRGAESDADAAFVRVVAGGLGLKCVVGRGDVRRAAGRGRGSIEMAAREFRHTFLARTARRLGCKAVALAHHADDQVELFFVRLLRGAGSEGLGGMKRSGPSPGDRTVRLVRPLLDQSKAALRAYAGREGISFRDDSSNAGDDFLRNRIRNKLIPLLEKYQPALLRTTLRAMRIIGAEQDFVREAALARLRSGARGAFKALHTAVQRQVLQIQLVRLGIPIDFDLVEKLRGEAECPVMIEPGLVVRRDEGGQIRKQRVSPVAFDNENAVIRLKGKGGRTEFGGVTVRWRIEVQAAKMPRFGAGMEYFDADKVGSEVCLRHWRAGDRFQPIGMAREARVQDLFVNGRIPRPKRHAAVVATTRGGNLFWVEGLRMAEGFKLDRGTRRRLKWEWRRNPLLRAG